MVYWKLKKRFEWEHLGDVARHDSTGGIRYGETLVT